MLQLQRIFNLLGTPSEAIWPGYTDLPNAKNVRVVPCRSAPSMATWRA
jgi:hypothetical protein